MVILTALSVTCAALLVQHLGLTEAVAKIAWKILSCSQCMVFWSVLSALLYKACDIVIAVVLAAFMSYISNWLVLLLIILQRKFTKTHEKENHC